MHATSWPGGSPPSRLGTPPPWSSCREDAGGLEVYLLRRGRAWPSPPGCYVFPGGSVDPRDADPAIAWAGPRRRPGPSCSAPTSGPPAAWCAPPCGRRSRSPGCCWPGRRGVRRRRHHRRGLGGRPARADRQDPVVRRVARRRGLVLRSTCSGPGRTGSPRSRAPALRHPVLRRGAPAGPGHPRRRRRGRPGRLGAARATRSTGGEPGQMLPCCRRRTVRSPELSAYGSVPRCSRPSVRP